MGKTPFIRGMMVNNRTQSLNGRRRVEPSLWKWSLVPEGGGSPRKRQWVRLSKNSSHLRYQPFSTEFKKFPWWDKSSFFRRCKNFNKHPAECFFVSGPVNIFFIDPTNQKVSSHSARRMLRFCMNCSCLHSKIIHRQLGSNSDDWVSGKDKRQSRPQPPPPPSSF